MGATMATMKDLKKGLSYSLRKSSLQHMQAVATLYCHPGLLTSVLQMKLSCLFFYKKPKLDYHRLRK